MRILVISDTHVPRTAPDMPQAVYDEIPRVDMILHAGDIVEKPFYDKLAALKPTVAVCGNMDATALQRILKAKEIVEVGGYRIGLIHGHGPSRAIIETVRREFKGVHAIVFGHSHIPANTVRDKVLFFNPGSPTDTVFAATKSYGILTVNDTGITGTIVTLS